MGWSHDYPKEQQPTWEEIRDYIASPLWQELCEFVENTYGVQPRFDYSICSGAPGWNVKYRKGSRALCTLYPNKDFFICMISVAGSDLAEAEMVLADCSPYTQQIYANSKPFNGGRWLMLEVRNSEIIDDIKGLLGVRCKPKQKA